MQAINGKGPATISPVLLQAIECLTKGAADPRGELAQAVLKLSRLFTKRRGALSQAYLKAPAFAEAYLRYFLPVNLSKIQLLLDEMPGETYLKRPTDRFSVLDLGAGPGAGALAVLDWGHHLGHGLVGGLSVVAVDNVQAALCRAERLWEWYCREAGITAATLQVLEGDLERPAKGPWLGQVTQGAPYDIILLANCLNEIHGDAPDPVTARTSLVTEMLSLLAPHGTLMIVEPALRETSRALHQVRDRLLQAGSCSVYSPCLHEQNCPALVNPDDWCHEERAWEPPASIQEIDREVGFIKDALKFSYLLLRKDGLTIVPRGCETFRVVSELRVLKGDKRAWLCNELGRSEIGRLDRAQSEANAAWDGCERGTIVRIEGVKRKEGAMLGRIPAEGTVMIVRPV